MADTAPAPAPEPADTGFGETVASSEVVASIWLSAVGGLAFLALWAFFRAPLRHIFLKRLQLPDAAARPPPVRCRGLANRCLGFLVPVFLVDDFEFVQTAGLDALILCRFLVLGCQVFIPITALVCSILLPLCVTGTYSSTSYAANIADIMRFTIGNVQPGSPKLWAPFALSYAVLAWAAYCLVQHYKSYALLRLAHLRHVPPGAAAAAPAQLIVGMQPRGWSAVGDALLQLCSPLYMVKRDKQRVRRYLEECAAAEARQLAESAGCNSESGGADADKAAAQKGLLGSAASDDVGKGGGGKGGEAAVLPWWLPPEDIPAPYSAELSCGGVVHGKTTVATRKRLMGVGAAGQAVWTSSEHYAVLLTTAGPPPSGSLWRLLRPQSALPSAVVVEGGPAEGTGATGTASSAVEGESDEGGSGKGSTGVGELGHSAQSRRLQEVLGKSGGQDAGQGAELLAAELEQALQELFPASFSSLVRVYNHAAVDALLVRHDAAATQRDRCAAQLAAARKAAARCSEEKGAGGAPGTKGWRAGLRAWRLRRAAARLPAAESELARWQEKTEGLEADVAAARAAALAAPLGTAFIALFRDQTTAALAAHVQASLAATVNFKAQPCPGPDDVNWCALWSSWKQRIVRAAAVVPFLTLMMIFPIGVLTGALSNLNTAVCGGTPETNSLYWPWYCEQTSPGAKFVKQLLQGILPSVISMLWDTYVLPMWFFFCTQAERRHVALSHMDRRMTALFYNFNVFNTFLGSVLGGAVFSQAGTLVNEPGYWLQMLGASLPTASTYFLNYIIIHALSTNFFRFIWPHEGTVLFVIFRWFGLFRPKCERDHAMIRTAPSFRGARHFGSFLLIQIMALTYAVIAPLVLPAAAVFFLTAWVTWRYCCLYFYERSYESGGRIWETLFTLVVWSMALCSVFTGLVLASKRAWTESLVLVFTQLPLLLLFHRRVSLEVGHYATVLPLQATLAAPRAELDPAIYTPPPLRPQAVGWYPEWGKVWEKYGVSRYSW